MDEAKKIFDLMLIKGLMADTHSYNVLITGHFKVKSIDQAVMLFLEMSGRGLVPDIVTYTTLIDGFCKQGRIQKLFSKMQACGQLPNVQTYAILLDGLCKNQQPSTEIELFEEMKGKKLDPNIVVYNC
ncbi:hypothetical protein ACFX16_029768 [Malus domestica]